MFENLQFGDTVISDLSADASKEEYKSVPFEHVYLWKRKQINMKCSCVVCVMYV